MRLVDELEADLEGAINLIGPTIPGGQRDSVFGCRSGDEGIVNSAARDAERCQAGMKKFRALGLRNRDPGKLCASSQAIVRGGAAGSVAAVWSAQKKVSRAACPLNPQLRPPMAFLVS